MFGHFTTCMEGLNTFMYAWIHLGLCVLFEFERIPSRMIWNCCKLRFTQAYKLSLICVLYLLSTHYPANIYINLCPILIKTPERPQWQVNVSWVVLKNRNPYGNWSRSGTHSAKLRFLLRIRYTKYKRFHACHLLIGIIYLVLPPSFLKI